MTGFFSLWYYFANVLADRRGYAPAKRLGEAIVFVVFFCLFTMEQCYNFFVGNFFVVTSAYLSTGPNATIARSLGERNPGCGLTQQSCISKHQQRLRSPNQRGMLCFAQCSPYCMQIWPCSRNIANKKSGFKSFFVKYLNLT